MPKQNWNLTVRHNVATRVTTIEGGVGDGGDVEIIAGRPSVIIWNAAGNEGRWVFDGIVFTGTFTPTVTPDQVVLTGPASGTVGEASIYQLRIKDVTTGDTMLHGSNMITKKAPPIEY